MNTDPHDEALAVLNGVSPSASLLAFAWYVHALRDPRRARGVAVEDLARLAARVLNGDE